VRDWWEVGIIEGSGRVAVLAVRCDCRLR
jgi:hypothetical protein